MSPYLFILVLEFLSAAIKNDPEITGVKISQYADDSSLILDDNPKSLDQSLSMLYTFSECKSDFTNACKISIRPQA
jgi:hypothetical protein